MKFPNYEYEKKRIFSNILENKDNNDSKDKSIEQPQGKHFKLNKFGISNKYHLIKIK